MKSCQFVADMLIFGHDHVSACCITPPSLVRPPVYVHGMGSLMASASPHEVLERIVETREHWYETDHVGRNGGCRSCVYLEDMDRAALAARPYPFRALNANHVENCNLICSYCYQSHPNYNRRKPKQLYVLPPLIRVMAERGLLDPAGTMFFGGGEPTLGGDFEELVGLCDEIGLHQNVNTNAVRFSPALEMAMKRSRRVLATVSIDAGTADTYAKVKGADVFETVLANVARYAASGGQARVKYIVLPQNFGEIEVLLDRLRGLPLMEFALDFDCGIFGQPAYPEDMWLAAERAAAKANEMGLRTVWTGYCRPMMRETEVARAERLNRRAVDRRPAVQRLVGKAGRWVKRRVERIGVASAPD